MAHEAGAVAATAATWNPAKYADLSHSHYFQPIAVETLGLMNSSVVSFFLDLGCIISQVSRFMGSVLSFPAHFSHHTMFQCHVIPRHETLLFPMMIQ